MKALQGQADVYNWSPQRSTARTQQPLVRTPLHRRLCSGSLRSPLTVRPCPVPLAVFRETHCYYQMLCYNAAAHYWTEQGAARREDKYGEEIAHLERGRVLLESATKVEASLLKNLADNRIKLLQAITTRMAAAQKDNDAIYFAAVPRQETIRDPEAVVTVKLTPFQVADAADPYAGLLSPLVKAQSDEFRVKLKEAVVKIERDAQESADYSKATLSSLGLPAALEAEEGEQGVSDELWASVHAIQYQGGRDALEAQIERIDIAVREAKSGVQTVVEDIGKEKADDDAMRQQFGSRWNRRSSEQLTAQFARDLDIIKKYPHRGRQEQRQGARRARPQRDGAQRTDADEAADRRAAAAQHAVSTRRAAPRSARRASGCTHCSTS